MKQFLVVFLGGGAGSVLRYLLSLYLSSATGINYAGTLFVNITGSLFLGVVLGLAFEKWGHGAGDWRLFLASGFAGGFTTFSTFSSEVLFLFKSGLWMQGLLYGGLSPVFGVLSAFAGYKVSSVLIK